VSPCSVPQRGLVLLALLIALAISSVAMMGALDVWALQRQRLREEELLFVGDQYRLAIQRYYETGHTLPLTIDDLIDDHRFPVPLHHLRRAYADPVTGRNDWQFLRVGGRIFGIYSSSSAVPVKHARFPRRYAYFTQAKSYADWQFFYLPPALAVQAPTQLMRVTPAQPGQPVTAPR
jgi:type II secretory pathway pseudopilin PulG